MGSSRCRVVDPVLPQPLRNPHREHRIDRLRAQRSTDMPDRSVKIGWIGMGRMGFPMAERLLKAGYDVSIWNRTRAKAEPLAKSGGKIVDKPGDFASVDVLFAIVSTGTDLEEVYFGPNGVGAANTVPPVFVDCS